MPASVFYPPTIESVGGPVLFLAGPIQGASDWQSEAIGLLREMAPGLHIACPRRDSADGTFDYDRQVDWETNYLRLSAERGVILFWLAREVVSVPGRAYAQTSRFELAEWKVRHERDGARLVVGIEDGFSGARYIRKRFTQDCPSVPLLGSLEETCRSAVERIPR